MDEIDSRTVTRALNARVRPILREAGFQKFAGRNAWRHHDFGVDHVGFPSFSDAIATGVGCTTFSFGGNAGVRYTACKPGSDERPLDYQMTFRGILNKYVEQPFFHPYGRSDYSDRSDVWYVLPDGGNLSDLVEDVVQAVLEQALPYLARLSTPRAALEVLRTEQATAWNRTHGLLGTWPPGNPGSPHWIEAHSMLATLSVQPNSEPSSAPVLTPAERWSVQHHENLRSWPIAAVQQSLTDAGLTVVTHQIPISAAESGGQERARDSRTIHLYINTDGTLNRASTY